MTIRLSSTEKLNLLRKRKGITVTQLAEYTGLSRGYIGTITSGVLAHVPARAQGKIAQALGVKPQEIFK